MMKIVHITDLHFGYHRQELIEPFLEELSLINPAVIILSGDMTHRAKKHEYQLLIEFLKKLPGEVLVVPGNHDIPLYDFFTRAFCPFAKFNSLIGSQFASSFSNETIRILGINTVNPFQIKDGVLTHHALKTIDDYFSEPFAGLNFLFFHHNYDYMTGLHKPLKNYQQFLKYLKDSPIHAVFTGHLHYANMIQIEKNNGQPCLQLHGGSLLCKRSKDGLNSFYILEVEGLNCQVNWRVFQDNGFQTQKTFTINFNN